MRYLCYVPELFMLDINHTIAEELNVKTAQVNAAVKLLDEGATVPFISRYRKEVTGSLDDTQLRTLHERLHYFRELEERRTSILKSIDEQGKLTPQLTTAINNALTKTRLEDLYLPYKPKRRTKGQIAIAAGLQALADELLTKLQIVPEEEAQKYINTDASINTTKDALDGAKYILMEQFAENADLLAKLRQKMSTEGVLTTTVIEGKQSEGEKFSDYFEYAEALAKIPPHRALAIFRGRRESILSAKLDILQADTSLTHPCELMIAHAFNLNIYKGNDTPHSKWLKEVVKWTWRIKLHMQIETDLLGDLREKGEESAITVFANNLKDLLLAAPAGQRATLGLDPGLRTGVKVAVIDATGAYKEHTTIYPHAPRNNWHESINTLAILAKKHQVELIAVGNGTASRETNKLAEELAKKYPELKLTNVMVSEAGASVYSASELAAKEFPELDVTIRGAISIARRLQDPLAELVKIEPQSIGVGQYQHDVSQFKLSKSLDSVIEDCVNAVGVEINTASAQLLSRVAGISQTLANNIVLWRTSNGALSGREQLKTIPRLGDKAFEQCAGFLRIRQSTNPLDNSAVHPESYHVVEHMAQTRQCNVGELIANKNQLKSLKASDFVAENTGLLTVNDIISELEKPGLDPRPKFETATFKEGIEKLTDLKPDMVLEGIITNVTNFGAFVDVGVHQDGLVHISSLSNTFVKDPHTVVKAGQIVKVKVLELDIQRKRISLTMRLNEKAEPKSHKAQTPNHNRSHKDPSSNKQTVGNNAFANAFAKAKNK